MGRLLGLGRPQGAKAPGHGGNWRRLALGRLPKYATQKPAKIYTQHTDYYPDYLVCTRAVVSSPLHSGRREPLAGKDLGAADRYRVRLQTNHRHSRQMTTDTASGVNAEPVRTWAAYLPLPGGLELSAYVDRCAAGFDAGPIWCDRWPSPAGWVVWVLGCDAGPIRCRLQLEWTPADVLRL